MKNIVLYCFVPFTLLLSCKSTTEKCKDALEIQIDIKSNKKSFCDVIKEIRFIVLEKTNNSLIGRIKEVKVVDEYIFVHDIINRSILVFSFPDGKYLSKIGSIGNGEGEYLSIFSFDVNQSDQCVEILDGNLKKLFKYSYSGNFKGYRKIPFYAMSFSYINEDKIAFTKYSIAEGEDINYQLIVTDNKINILNKSVKIKNHTSILVAQGNQISKLNSEISFLPINSPVIYSAKGNETSAKYFLDFGDNWNSKMLHSNVSTPKQLVDILNSKNLIRGLGVMEGEHFLLFEYWLQKEHYITIYNKKLKDINNIISTQQGLDRMTFFTGYHNGYFISAKEATDITNLPKSEYNCLDKKSIELIENFDESNNPVLMFAKFK